MEALAELAAAGLSSSAGSMLAGATSGGSSKYKNPQYIDMMNQTLNQYLNKAINSSTGYTNQAIGQQNTGLNNATNIYQNAAIKANQAASGQLQQGLKQYQTLQSPYANAGYNALDAYMGTLGLSTPTVGSHSVVQANQIAPQFNSLLQQYLKNGLITQNANGTIALQQSPQFTNTVAQDLKGITNDQIRNYINSNVQGNQNMIYTGVGANDVTKSLPSYGYYGNTDMNNYQGGPIQYGQGISIEGTSGALNAGPNLLNYLYDNSTISNAVRQQLAKQQYQQQQQQYQQNLKQYNNNFNGFRNSYNSLAQSGLTPQSIAIANAYNQGIIQ